MAFSKSTIIKWSGLLMVIAITAAVAFTITFQTAAYAVKGFLGALAVSGFAGGLALIPIFYAVSHKPDLTQILSLAAGGIRLLLTIAGIVTICLLVNINFLWFFGWTAVFYLVILVIEIRVALAAMDLNKINGAAQA
ncbi:MAG: hypothetical protein ABSH16_12910 [Sedimentisphaerales bacterium]